LRFGEITVADPATSADVGSEIFLAAAFFLCVTDFFLGAGATALVSATAGAAGATVAGAGISGNAFVFTCATADVAIIIPKTSQQFVFINQ